MIFFKFILLTVKTDMNNHFTTVIYLLFNLSAAGTYQKYFLKKKLINFPHLAKVFQQTGQKRALNKL